MTIQEADPFWLNRLENGKWYAEALDGSMHLGYGITPEEAAAHARRVLSLAVGLRPLKPKPTDREREALILAGDIPTWEVLCTQCEGAVPPSTCVFCGGSRIAQCAESSVIYDFRFGRDRKR